MVNCFVKRLTSLKPQLIATLVTSSPLSNNMIAEKIRSRVRKYTGLKLSGGFIVQLDGINTYASAPEKWWTNTIEELPDSTAGGSIDVDNGGSISGKIFVVNSSKSGGSYNFISEKMSLVVMEDVELKKDSNNAWCLF